MIIWSTKTKERVHWVVGGGGFFAETYQDTIFSSPPLALLTLNLLLLTPVSIPIHPLPHTFRASYLLASHSVS